MAVTWDDAYVWPEVQSRPVREADRESTQRITTGFSLRRSARTIRLTPLGKGDWNTLAAGYRRIAEQKGFLPPWGFVVDGPSFSAFYAKRVAGREYPDGTLFTLQAMEGPSLPQATKLRVFHGFGDPQFMWRGKSYQIPRHQVLVP